MPDRETVITHLMIIHTWAEFARERDLQFFTEKHLEDIAQWSDDALALLKEQPDIVQCKNCENYYEGHCRCDDTIYWNREPDWYCADGERKEGGKA